jgi:hypothetical protein
MWAVVTVKLARKLAEEHVKKVEYYQKALEFFQRFFMDFLSVDFSS